MLPHRPEVNHVNGQQQILLHSIRHVSNLALLKVFD